MNDSYDSEEDLPVDVTQPPGTVSKKRAHYEVDDEYEPPTKKVSARSAERKRTVATPHATHKK